MMRLPAHLRRYVVSQDYDRYTPVDQAVWRYIMRQLASYLATHGHPAYLKGLRDTGISVDRIPHLDEMSEKLNGFGWNVVPVSGFIPPAAFMELQAHGFLPVACDLRTVDHILYTPAPDIVHEAAGHAPILIDPEFAAYLKSYAQVAAKAIISSEDMAQYEAIRVLSDLKEDASSTPAEIAAAEAALVRVNSSISHVSEAALLGRMNWWTAEYGLVGSLESPRIYGAGLLSSIEESRHCLSAAVQKIPLTVDCIDYSYDITEMQPQLFVTPDFAHLSVVLDQLADRMAFRLGGTEGLARALKAATVNTVELDSGLQISGKLKAFGDGSYLQFEGPCQLSFDDTQIDGHGIEYHAQGFGSPVGTPRGVGALVVGKRGRIDFESGVVVEGIVKSIDEQIISWTDCRVTRGDETLFDPSWGTYDMARGQRVVSVFGGPADRLAYGETDDFVAKVIPRKTFTPSQRETQALYQAVRDVREGLAASVFQRDAVTSDRLLSLFEKVTALHPNDWLIRLEILEIAREIPSTASWLSRLESQLEALSTSDKFAADRIAEGVRVFGKNF